MGLTDIFVAVGIWVYLFGAMMCTAGTAAGLYAHRFWTRQARGSDVWLFAMSMRVMACGVSFASVGFGAWVAWAVYGATTPLMLVTGWPLFIVGFVFEGVYLFGIYLFLRFVEVLMKDGMTEQEKKDWPWWLIWDYPEEKFTLWFRQNITGRGAGRNL